MKCVSCGEDFGWGEYGNYRIHPDAPKRPRCWDCLEKIFMFKYFAERKADETVLLPKV